MLFLAWSAAREIPKTWDEQALESLELPLPGGIRTVHMPAELYYQMPERPIYRIYPVYAPDREPKGYLEYLQGQEPQIVFDPIRLKTTADWIRAGELVFDTPLLFAPGPKFARLEDVRNPEWYKATGMPVAKDGTVPIFHYVVRQKGKVELGFFGCAMCHTRLLPDGNILKGAQSNYPVERAVGFAYRAYGAAAKNPEQYLVSLRDFEYRLYAAPWLRPDFLTEVSRMSLDRIAASHEAIPAGVLSRQRASAFSPPKIADLIGVKDRLYLDATGIVQQRSIGDLMRYSALNQGADTYDRYGEFFPAGKYPDPKKTIGRYSDAQLYALAMYLYSLQPPKNPNRFDAQAARGKKVFDREGCGTCHTPPLYTDNKLMPAAAIGTDPGLTLRTRRGSGYYKVPSLKNLWLRGPFEHNGSVATLEDWFDPKRLKDDYIPTGFRGYGVKTRAVKGHEFGLHLSQEDKSSLIRFLDTL